MIVFSPLRTRRVDAQLHELSIGDEIALCHLPENAHEKALTEFLSRAVESATASSPKHLSDPRAWSVSERLLALAHYCIHTRDDRPDYAVTEVSKVSDYLDMQRDLPAAPATFSALGDSWTLVPLSGAAAEVLEALQLESDLSGRAHWLIGGMAAQLLRQGEQHPDPVTETTDYAAWLEKRIGVLREFPSSSFDVLFARYREAVERDSQFFSIWFDDQGVVVLPKEAGALTPPARFLVLACIGAVALSLAGKA
jgi:hypothetical protein